MKKNLLELFSGTHSVGKVAIDKYNVISLDRDLEADIMEDIMKWDYKKYPKNHFYIITASPVCLWWSRLRNCWINRKCKSIHPTDIITKKHIEDDINKYGKPMIDKVFEIIEYFNPKYYWIENPQTGKMKDYIKEKYPQYNIFYDVDYCKYTDWGYKKRTRFWTNIKDFNPKICKNDCDNIVINNNQKLHKHRMGTAKTVIDNNKIIRVNTKELRDKYKDYDNIQLNKPKYKHFKDVAFHPSSKLERYRIPELLIKELLDKCI